jgi:hypothetical protein
MEKNKEISKIEKLNKILKSNENNQKKSELLIEMMNQIKEFSIVLCLDPNSNKYSDNHKNINENNNDINKQEFHKNTNFPIQTNINMKKKENDYIKDKNFIKTSENFKENKIITNVNDKNCDGFLTSQEDKDVEYNNIKNKVKDENTKINLKINNKMLKIDLTTKFNKKENSSISNFYNKNFPKNIIANSISKIPIQKETYNFCKTPHSNNNNNLAIRSLGYISQNRGNNMHSQKNGIVNNNVISNHQNCQNQKLYINNGYQNNTFYPLKNYQKY